MHSTLFPSYPSYGFFFFHPPLKAQIEAQSRFHLIFFFLPCFSCRYARLRRPIHQVTHHPESVSACLYFPEKSAQFCTAPRCLASCPPHFALRGSQSSKLEASQISERSRRSARVAFSFSLWGWSGNVRWARTDGFGSQGDPEHKRKSCSKPPPEMLKTNAKKKKHWALWIMRQNWDFLLFFPRLCLAGGGKKKI